MSRLAQHLIHKDRMWRRLEDLAQFGRTADGGVTRLALSSEDRAAVKEVGTWLEPLGFSHRLDSAGNHFWRHPGGSQGPAVLLGSHLDSVPNGGRFDGVAGVVAAAEVAQLLVESGKQLQRPIEVVTFANEEGVRFPGGLMGSQALAGGFEDDSLLDVTDSAGVSLRSALTAFGVVRPSLTAARHKADSVAAYFELHVEQGRVLEAAGAPAGLVSGITGLYQARLEFTGRSGHAGATPMSGRRDPMAGAAQIVQHVEKVARSSGGAVRGTVGWIEAKPGAENVIPDSVRFAIDVRTIDGQALREAVNEVFIKIEAVRAERGLGFRVMTEQHTEPVMLDQGLRSRLEAAARELGVDYRTLPSGGGHDAMIMQGVCPAAMVFVRSRDGLSHCPEEYSSPEDLAAAAGLLLLGVAQAVGVNLG